MMVALLRPFLALLLAVTLLGVTAFEASANLTSEIVAAAEPCCDGDCPNDPACEASCTMMQRCGTTISGLPQASEQINTRTVTALFPDDESLPGGLAPHGLKRPPRI